jgi:putative DNA methylase
MIPKECKRLAEVDFPIAVVSRHAAKEKSIRFGHPSTLHLWWARRPLASCRALLMALLLPDPCDPNCPSGFKHRVREILPRVQGHPGKGDVELRTGLLRFIGDFADWDNAANPSFLEAAHELIRAVYGGDAPLVVDPFAGGGSIPFEGLRLGCDAFGSDLNPVACMILKTMLEDIPRHGLRLADESRRLGKEIKTGAETELGEVYPRDTDGSKPIAFIWARTITCDSCGAEIPLMRSFWLSKKSDYKRALRFEVKRQKGTVPVAEFEIFEPKRDSDVPLGTISRARATCPCCDLVTAPERVRAQLGSQHGGADVLFDDKGNRVGGARLLAVVTVKQGEQGRHYRLSGKRDYAAVHLAEQRLASILARWKRDGEQGLCPVPNELLPSIGTLGFRVQRYGILHWGDLFTARQKLGLVTLARLVNQCSGRREAKEIAGLAVSRLTDIYNAQGVWETTKTQVRNLFSRQAIAMRWDFAEASAIAEQAGDYQTTLETMIRVIERLTGLRNSGQAQQADAAAHPLPDATASVWFTDPPYYDAIPYSDLSDFFYVWLKRALPQHPLLRDPTDPTNPLTPKRREAVQDETKQDGDEPKDRAWFEKTMGEAFTQGRRVLSDDGIGCVVFAHKTTEGWEALLSGMIQGGWVITASWPLTTEMATRLRARESAALSASIHLVCRPRPNDAPTGDWGEVIRELPRRVGDWIERLQTEGVRGADLVFACIGPAMEIYSRYARVEDAEGREIPLGGDPIAIEPYKRGFLAYVWETVGRLALEQVLGTAEAKARNGASGALEEDSRLTALFLWTIQATDTDSTGNNAEPDDDDADEDEEKTKKKKAGLSLIYDVARRFAQPLGIHLDKWEGRIIETEKGVVRLLPVGERATQLFGEADASAMAHRIEQDVKASRNYTFAFMQDVAAPPEIKPRGRGKAKATGATTSEAPAPQMVTTLDRLHAAMLLQANGQSNGLRALLKEEQQRGPDFLRLANSLSALYPKDSEEKRLLDAMLLAVPRN